MDEMVLKAQRWVNATYGAVPGYVACAETGTTGWPTMYSLTRALQHELGITALSGDDRTVPTLLDFGGWGGDLISALGDFLKSGQPAGNAYDYARSHIASYSNDGFFDIGDFLADVDAVCLGAQTLSDPNLPLSTMFRYYYGSVANARQRFADFFISRFGNSPGILREAGRNVCVGLADVVFMGAREKFWHDSWADDTGYALVEAVPDDIAADVARAFADVLASYAP